jgi:ADP-ribose pyrophosphatase YjhB (NUDIX family)
VSVVWSALQRPVEPLASLAARAAQHETGLRLLELRARHVEVDGQQAERPHQDVVRELGLDPADATPVRRNQASADERRLLLSSHATESTRGAQPTRTRTAW